MFSPYFRKTGGGFPTPLKNSGAAEFVKYVKTT